MKKFIAFVLLIVAMAMMFGCGMAKPTDLTGKWVLAEGENDSIEDLDLVLNISDDVAQVDIVSGNARMLCWYGTYEAPTETVDEYSWVSVNDPAMTKDSLFAPEAETTTFRYENGKMYFDLTVFGVAYTFVFEREVVE